MDPDLFYKTIKATVMPNNATVEQTAAMLMVAHEYGLNPLLKQIYAFPSKGGGITPMISIDGWCELINRHPQYDGAEFEDHIDADGKVYAISCRMHRKDRGHATVVTEYMDECYRATEPWKTSPKRMLRHRALIQAARYSLGLSAAFDIDHTTEVEGAAVEVDYEPIKKTLAVPAAPARGGPSRGFDSREIQKVAPNQTASGGQGEGSTEVRPEWTSMGKSASGAPAKADQGTTKGPIEKELDLAGINIQWTLNELIDAFSSAQTKTQLEAIYNDYDVDERYKNDPENLDKAQDAFVKRMKTIEG
jgi:phage recombination protein Bet